MQKKLFRSFFAIDLPLDAKKIIVGQIKALAANPYLKQVKWTKTINLHLTLSFLGNITYEQSLAIDRGVHIAIKNLASFTIMVTGLQLFPNARRPHSLVLNPEPVELISQLAHILSDEAKACGIAIEKKKFRPHITLGKIRGQSDFVNNFFRQSKIKKLNLKVKVTQIKLFKSEPSLEGSVYTPIATYRIG